MMNALILLIYCLNCLLWISGGKGSTYSEVSESVNSPTFNEKLEHPKAFLNNGTNVDSQVATLFDSQFEGMYKKPFQVEVQKIVNEGKLRVKRDTNQGSDLSNIIQRTLENQLANRGRRVIIGQALNLKTGVNSLVNGGESEETVENKIHQMYNPQNSIESMKVTHEGVKVHCIQAGRDEVICSHGDFTYKITLPERFMTQETVEGLVSSIYNNVELGRRTPLIRKTGSSGFNLGKKDYYNDISLTVSKQVPQTLIDYSMLGNITGSKRSDVADQLIRLSFPLEDQSALKNDTDSLDGRLTLVHPEIQTQSLMGRVPSSGLPSYVSRHVTNNQNLTSKDLDERKILGLSILSNIKQDLSNYSLNGNTLKLNGGNQENSPFNIGFVQGQSEANITNPSLQTSGAYASQWLGKRNSGDRDREEKGPLRILIIRKRNNDVKNVGSQRARFRRKKREVIRERRRKAASKVEKDRERKEVAQKKEAALREAREISRWKKNTRFESMAKSTTGIIRRKRSLKPSTRMKRENLSYTSESVTTLSHPNEAGYTTTRSSELSYDQSRCSSLGCTSLKTLITILPKRKINEKNVDGGNRYSWNKILPKEENSIFNQGKKRETYNGGLKDSTPDTTWQPPEILSPENFTFPFPKGNCIRIRRNAKFIQY